MLYDNPGGRRSVADDSLAVGTDRPTDRRTDGTDGEGAGSTAKPYRQRRRRRRRAAWWRRRRGDELGERKSIDEGDMRSCQTALLRPIWRCRRWRPNDRATDRTAEPVISLSVFCYATAVVTSVGHTFNLCRFVWMFLPSCGKTADLSLNTDNLDILRNVVYFELKALSSNVFTLSTTRICRLWKSYNPLTGGTYYSKQQLKNIKVINSVSTFRLEWRIECTAHMLHELREVDCACAAVPGL